MELLVQGKVRFTGHLIHCPSALPYRLYRPTLVLFPLIASEPEHLCIILAHLYFLFCAGSNLLTVFPRLFVIFLLVHSSLYILALKLHHRCNKHFSQSAAYPVALFMVTLLKTFPFWGCQISVPFLLWPPKMPSPTQSIKNREING